MCAVISAAIRIGGNRVRHKLVFRMSYIVKKESLIKLDNLLKIYIMIYTLQDTVKLYERRGG